MSSRKIKERLAAVAEFHKASNGKLTLFSLVTFERGTEHDGRQYVLRATYDVDFSRTYGYLFNQSGFGGNNTVSISGIYFACGKVTIKETPCQLVDPLDKPPWRGKKTRTIRERNRTRRLKRLPKAFTSDTAISLGLKPGEDLLDWLQNNAIEQDAVYCSDCRDFVPGDQLCQHCWWCDKISWYSTPAERCKCKDREECNG